MPDQIGSTAGLLNKALEWLVLGVTGLVGILWKANDTRFSKIENRIENFSTKEEIHELKNNLHSRFDKLDEESKVIDKKIDKILERVLLGVSREEFDNKTDQLHARINDLEKSKADK